VYLATPSISLDSPFKNVFKPLEPVCVSLYSWISYRGCQTIPKISPPPTLRLLYDEGSLGGVHGRGVINFTIFTVRAFFGIGPEEFRAYCLWCVIPVLYGSFVIPVPLLKHHCSYTAAIYMYFMNSNEILCNMHSTCTFMQVHRYVLLLFDKKTPEKIEFGKQYRMFFCQDSKNSKYFRND